MTEPSRKFADVRNPENYRPDPDGHYSERVHDRDIPATAVVKAVRDGDHNEQANGYTRCETTYLGTAYTVIIDKDRWFLITAYEGR